MGRISASHTAGLDLLDQLFFNQILVHCLFTQERRWLNNLAEDLDRELTDKGMAGVQRQVVKHGVLCLMEAELSDSLFLLKETYPENVPPLPEDITMEQLEESERYKLNFFEGYVLAILSKAHACDKDVTIDITYNLLEKYAQAPATVRYRLMERMFAFEFIAAPIDCFAWLSRMGVLKSVKHPGAALASCHSPEFLPRLALLCEFNVLRDHIRRQVELGTQAADVSVENIRKIVEISDKTIRLLSENKKKETDVNNMASTRNSVAIIDLAEIENPAKVNLFFARLHAYTVRFRVFQGSLASWVGMLCGGTVEILQQSQDKKTPIFTGEFNEGTSTQEVYEQMSKRGFEITPRAIYDRHRDFKETALRAVTIYYKMKLFENGALPPDVKDLTYEAVSWQFEYLTPTARRNASSPT